MPIFEYICRNCQVIFEEFHHPSAVKKPKSTTCPNCQKEASRYYGSPFASPGKIERKFSEDEPKYREMHYYEKKGDWRRAAEAAKDVSNFAYEKFRQKAEQDN